MNGSCLCDGVTFSAQGQPEKVLVCYCKHCSKNAGAPGQFLAKFPRESVKILSGEDLMQTYILKDTSSGSPKHKVFCKTCGCTLWTIPQHHGGNALIVRVSLLENGLDELLPEVELFGQRKPKALGAAAELTSK